MAIVHGSRKKSPPRAVCAFTEERQLMATRDHFFRATCVVGHRRLHRFLSSRAYASRMTLAAPQPTSTKADRTSQLYLFPYVATGK